MKYIVRGGNSFIGKAFLKQYPDSILMPRPFVETPDAAAQFLAENKHDAIINFSTYGNYYHQTDHNLTWTVNVKTPTILSMCAGRKPFINFSTSSVLLQKQTDYSLSKIAAENILKQNGGTSIRPSTVIGVGEQSHHLIPTLIRSCLLGEKMPFVPTPTHDFIDVDMVVKAIPFCLYLEEAINVSSGITHTNEQVRKLVEHITGKKANVEIVDRLRDYDTKHWLVDNSRLRELGFSPSKTLLQTIEEMVDDAKQRT